MAWVFGDNIRAFSKSSSLDEASLFYADKSARQNADGWGHLPQSQSRGLVPPCPVRKCHLLCPIQFGEYRAPRVRGQQSDNDILRMPGKWFLKSRRAAPRGDRESDRGRGRGVLVKLPRLNGARKNLREKYVRGVLVRGRAGAK